MTTTYSTYVEGTEVYSGTDLETAIRTWDQQTYNRTITHGWIEANSPLRSGYILHYTGDRVYLNPNLADKSAA